MAQKFTLGLLLVVTSSMLAQQQPTNSTGQNNSANTTVSPATEDKTATPIPSTTPSADFARLRVYRHRRFAGSALAPSIYVDDQQIARVGNGRRCSIKLAPGAHNIRSDDKSSAISLDVKPGQEYYIRIDEEPGFWKGHGKLTMLVPEQGSSEYKLQKPIEEDRKMAKAVIEQEDESMSAQKEDQAKKK